MIYLVVVLLCLYIFILSCCVLIMHSFVSRDSPLFFTWRGEQSLKLHV